MEFGSKFVYNYSGSEEEDVSDDEFEDGMHMDLTCSARSVKSAIADDVRPPAAAAAGCPPLPPQRQKKQHRWTLPSSPRSTDPRAPTEPPPVRGCARNQTAAEQQQERISAGKRWRRADTNVVAIKFDHLAKPSNMHTGDAVSCANCQALMSHISRPRLQENDDSDQVWLCEFCDGSNKVDVLPGEIPTSSDVTYLLSPAPSTSASSCSGADESIVVFCIDTSGSMCVSQEVEGVLNLKGNHADRYRSLNSTGENQWMPRQSRNVTYITRLQGLQAAVDHQLEQLAKDHPNRRVALITFNSEVTVIGDGTATPVTVAGDKLSNYDELNNVASVLPVPNSIQSSRAALAKTLFDLEEGGQTALGPALLIAINMASKAAGSKVIMCTDGLANVGLGNLDEASDEQYKIASAFYTNLGETARMNGVVVSVLTIAGTDCKLVDLGGVASATGGQVDIVDPLKLTQEFGNILANPVIATHVEATFIVHKGLYIRGEPEKTSCVKRDIGNVTADKEITFEYGVRTAESKNKGGESEQGGAAEGDSKPSDVIKELPFQVQIRYTDVDGAVALRVLTKLQPVTRNRGEAEKYINMPVVGCHAAKQSSELALQGEYTPARMNAFMYQRLAYRNAGTEDYNMYLHHVSPLESGIRSAQMVEARSRGRSLATYEAVDESIGATEETSTGSGGGGGLSSRLSKFFHAKPTKTMRKKTCPDELSNAIFHNKAVSSSAFQSGNQQQESSSDTESNDASNAANPRKKS